MVMIMVIVFVSYDFNVFSYDLFKIIHYDLQNRSDRNTFQTLGKFCFAILLNLPKVGSTVSL